MKSATSLAAILALCAAVTVPMPALAQITVDLNLFSSAPPAVRYEAQPPARAGYIWAPGYWAASGNGHDWRAGHWERARSGYTYERPQWVQDNGGWRLRQANWKAEQKQEKHDRKHDRKHDKNENHCPPGQAKKGNC